MLLNECIAYLCGWRWILKCWKNITWYAIEYLKNSLAYFRGKENVEFINMKFRSFLFF